jgi:site-specific DNA recombinase
MKDAISYIRVSSEEQADSGLGLEAQPQRIAAYCTMKGLHLAEVFEDPACGALSRRRRMGGSQCAPTADR